MTKKITAFFTAALICAVVCSCSCSKDREQPQQASDQNILQAQTQEQDERQSIKESRAEAIQLTRLGHDLSDNAQTAKRQYDGTVYSITGFVSEIDPDCVTLLQSDGVSAYSVTVYLSEDELDALDEGRYITVAGRLSIGSDEESCIMDPAYLVTDEYELDSTITKIYKGSARYDSADYGIIKTEIGGATETVRINISADKSKKYEVGDPVEVRGRLYYDEDGEDLGAPYTMQSPKFSD